MATFVCSGFLRLGIILLKYECPYKCRKQEDSDGSANVSYEKIYSNYYPRLALLQELQRTVSFPMTNSREPLSAVVLGQNSPK